MEKILSATKEEILLIIRMKTRRIAPIEDHSTECRVGVSVQKLSASGSVNTHSKLSEYGCDIRLK